MKPALVIVGLGNPGAPYAATRHNVGWRALDVLSTAYGEGEWREVQRFAAALAEARVGVAPVLLVKPLTYMNNSGETVRKLVDFYKLDVATQVLVLSDDIDLPLGELRLRMGGGPGTHNGLRSIVSQVGEAFPRLRIGLGTRPAGADLAAWVLSVPPEEERKVLDGALAVLPELVRSYVMERMGE